MKRLALILLLVVFGCDDDSTNTNNNNTNNTNTNNTNNLPLPRCHANSSTEIEFTDVSSEVLIDPENLHLLGNRMAAVDINGDGWHDIIVHKGNGANRDEVSTEEHMRGKRVLLNSEDPLVPGKRIFVDFTSESGYDLIPGTNERGRGASFAVAGDFNNDGNLDLLSGVYASITDTQVVDRPVVLLGDGQGHFSISTGTLPFNDEDLNSVTSAALTDYNRDGNLDIFMGYFYLEFGSNPQQDRLYKGSGSGGFRDVTIETGLETFPGGADENINHKPTYGVTVCDADGDGWPDLMSSSYGRAFNMLWKSSEGSTFTDAGETSTFRADDQMDYSDNQFYACHCQLNPGPECTEVPADTPMIQCSSDYWYVGNDDQPFRNGGNTFSTICADFNNDGHMDAYHAEIRHWHIGNSSDPSQLLVNTGSANLLYSRPGNEVTGLDRNHEMVDWNEGDITAVYGDFNNDGLLDIFVGDSDYPGAKGRLFIQNQDHTFEERAEELGIYAPRAGGVTWIDYDQDGDLDLLVGFSTMRCTAGDDDCIYSEPVVRLFRNDGGSNANRVVVRLKGAGMYNYSNSSAIGAKVRITAGGVTQIRELQSGFGHFGIQTPLELHFGLGDICEIESLEVIWPDGTNKTTVINNLSANYIYNIHEIDGVTSWQELSVN
ncbi:CRTAC1 family protein [Myxococcota bacterium]|nr:CRTAC1 family protein [Myxococcota bacterium]MBU1380078.1 CRTAC1 family protein [Myxococcota bacterium]MBU1495536.1 CRTAC1 family protein [Myxococcota bacterium]